ncbi:membrane protein DedA with SNARE-associated domain [Serratia fonticola]|jgi:membrane protein DedA with SNARE-associated domain|uniref:Membrane protein DedA with SNARE-associated domain n=1 Tax=Serratia fonticola TaxID=47917 RepID=A0A542BLU4_SERFO|nr:DedA family protein [Serratia fonticola]TQI79569.1 membrane protein DedA with SNARE-associated domain [Serratia fonticola]TQI98405.1 membrane protein DedA with SNARE-associated domain [Serratia fonticola]TVZ67934.1 membrane protein DedA with SNARE-associated domain [Serratia fonticola]
MTDLAHYITQYGYWALLIGCLLEGETITMLGGIAAHNGLLRLPWVIAVVAFGGTLGDQLLYFAGRHFGGRVLSRMKNQQSRIERAQKLIASHPVLFVIGVRFMYGFRIIGPVLIGASKLPPSRFIPLNILGAILWATLFVLLGYFGGQAISHFFTGTDKKLYGLLFCVLVVAAILLVRYWWRRRRSENAR